MFFRRETPTENTALCSVPTICASDEFESPPNSKLIIKSNKPPPLNRGKRFLKTVADDKPAPARTKTYNLRRFAEDTHRTSSPAKHEATNSRKRAAKTKEIAKDESPTKRSKSTEISASISTPTKSTNRTIDSAYKDTQDAIRPNNGTCSNQRTYTELKYLESIGSIRTIRRAKHPGINKVPSVKTEAVTPFI